LFLYINHLLEGITSSDPFEERAPFEGITFYAFREIDLSGAEREQIFNAHVV